MRCEKTAKKIRVRAVIVPTRPEAPQVDKKKLARLIAEIALTQEDKCDVVKNSGGKR